MLLLVIACDFYQNIYFRLEQGLTGNDVYWDRIINTTLRGLYVTFNGGVTDSKYKILWAVNNSNSGDSGIWWPIFCWFVCTNMEETNTSKKKQCINKYINISVSV